MQIKHGDRARRRRTRLSLRDHAVQLAQHRFQPADGRRHAGRRMSESRSDSPPRVSPGRRGALQFRPRRFPLLERGRRPRVLLFDGNHVRMRVHRHGRRGPGKFGKPCRRIEQSRQRAAPFHQRGGIEASEELATLHRFAGLREHLAYHPSRRRDRRDGRELDRRLDGARARDSFAADQRYDRAASRQHGDCRERDSAARLHGRGFVTVITGALLVAGPMVTESGYVPGGVSRGIWMFACASAM